MKGQAASEFLVTLGILLAFTVPVLLLMFVVSQMGYEETTMSQADASARTLSETINSVYSQGVGAKRVVLLNTPPSTKEISVGNYEVSVSIATSKGNYDGVSPTFANVRQKTIIKKAGLFSLVVEAKKSGDKVVVEIDCTDAGGCPA
jgi:hypothetical protein